MRSHIRLVSALLLAVMLALVVAGGSALARSSANARSSAAKARNFKVLVGKDLEAGKGNSADAMRFLPSRIRVHRGDSITFTGEFHTATALPVGTKPGPWINSHARHFGQTYFFLAADDEPHTTIFNPRVIYPKGCSRSGSCTYNGKSLVNSGLLGLVTPKTTMKINAAPGSSFWVICLVHPQMQMHVRVVRASTHIRTQAQINASVKRLVRRATANATALWSKLNHQHSHTTPSGKRVIDAYAGFDTKHLELFGMFPKVLNIHKGQTVEWHFNQIRFEPHSVVFPAKTAQQISTGPPPMCEKNNGSGDVPANQNFTCPAGSHGPIEIELDPRILQQGGNGQLTSTTDYENSGARGGFDIPNHKPYFLTFPVSSPKGGFRYACGVHGLMMSGFVKVR